MLWTFSYVIKGRSKSFFFQLGKVIFTFQLIVPSTGYSKINSVNILHITEKYISFSDQMKSFWYRLYWHKMCFNWKKTSQISSVINWNDTEMRRRKGKAEEAPSSSSESLGCASRLPLPCTHSHTDTHVCSWSTTYMTLLHIFLVCFLHFTTCPSAYVLNKCKNTF